MSLAAEIRDYFVRHFLGRVKIHDCRDSMILASPEVFTLRHVVETHPIRTHMEIRSPDLLVRGGANGGLKCSNGGFRFAKAIVKVRGESVRHYDAKEILVAHVPLIHKRALPHDGIKQIILLPQERYSRLRWQKARPSLVPGESVLAWYGPLIESAVLRMTLNRQRGTLLVWYDPNSRHFTPRGLYLCRRFGINTKPEWRWV